MVTTDALFIDGVQVDLAPNTTVALEWRGPLSGDFDEIAGNSSYTVTLLPYTIANRKVFRDAQSPSAVTGKRSVYLDAEYIHNGLSILPNAKAILMSTSADGFEVVLTWGDISDALREWLASGYSLREGFITDVLDPWDGALTPFSDREQVLIRADYDAGNFTEWSHPSGVATKMPSANCLALVEGIAAQRGVGILLPQEAESILRDTALLLTTRNSSAYADAYGSIGSEWSYLQVPANSSSLQSGKTYGLDAVSNIKHTQVLKVFNPGDDQTYAWRAVYKNNGSPVTLKMSAGLPDQEFGSIDDPENSIYWEVYGLDNADDITLQTFITRIYPTSVRYNMPDGSRYRVIFDINQEIDASDYEAVVFELVGAPSDRAVTYSGDEGDIIISASLSEVPVKTGVYPLSANLPDISEIDFLKSMAAYCGCFIAWASNGLEFVRYADLVGGNRRGGEIGGKLVPNTYQEVDGLEFSFGDFAQRNTFQYEEDGLNYGYLAPGTLYVDDESLERVTEYYTSPYSASRGNEVRQWRVISEVEKDENGGEETVWSAEMADANVRLMTIRANGAGNCSLVFTPAMTWANILATRYAEYQAIVRKPVVVTATLALDEADLRALDLSRSYYIWELGHNYAIITAQWSAGDGVTEVTMLQLD